MVSELAHLLLPRNPAASVDRVYCPKYGGDVAISIIDGHRVCGYCFLTLRGDLTLSAAPPSESPLTRA
jgi:hypothetical protein